MTNILKNINKETFHGMLIVQISSNKSFRFNFELLRGFTSDFSFICWTPRSMRAQQCLFFERIPSRFVWNSWKRSWNERIALEALHKTGQFSEIVKLYFYGDGMKKCSK